VTKGNANASWQDAEKSFAGHGPAAHNSQVIDLPLWGAAARCQRSAKRDFFSSLLEAFPGVDQHPQER
jgi:hypothetical protein